LDREDVAKLKAACSPNSRIGRRNRAALEVLHRCGLRVAELCALRPADVRWKLCQVVVRQGKGRKDRVVPGVGDDVLGALRAWQEVRPEGAQALFCTLDGRPTSPRYWQQALKRLAKHAGVDPATVTPHVLRHCFASEALEDGMTLAEVSALLGHSDLATTAIYLHARPTELGKKLHKVRAKRAAEDAEEAQETAPRAPDPLAVFVGTLTAEQRDALAWALLAAQGAPQAPQGGAGP